ncbi:MAG: FecR domain-containing protein [Gammaproteobacteria bacterium]
MPAVCHPRPRPLACALSLALCVSGAAVRADEPAGIVKVASGAVAIERAGAQLGVSAGTPVQPADIVVTGADGRCGITFRDNSLLSLGPNSRLVVDTFRFDSTTHEGGFDSTLKQGRLAVVSGKLAKHGKDQMKIRTPSSILGVRGTEFVVEAAAPQ